MKEIALAFANTSIASAGFAFIIGLICINYQSRIFKLLIALVLLSFSFDIASYIIIFSGIKSAYPSGNIYHILQFIIISAIYYQLFPAKKIRLVIIAVIFIYTILSTLHVFTDENLFKLLSLPRSVSSVVFIIYSIFYYVNLVNADRLESLRQNTQFYLNSTFFLYFSSLFVIYLVSQYMRSNENLKSYHSYLWTIHNVFGIAKNFMFAYMFYLNKKVSSV